MMNNFNLPQNQMDSLLKMAGQKMGKDPNELKSQLESGQMDQLLSGMDQKQQEQVKSVLNNPQAVNQILGNPQVQKLLGNLMKGK